MSKKNDGKNIVLLGDVLKIGRELGLQDPAAQKLFQRWLTDVQFRVEKIDTPLSRVKLEITCAEMYMELDLMDEAAECFRDALYEAQQEGLRELMRDLERALQTIETVAPPSRYGELP